MARPALHSAARLRGTSIARSEDCKRNGAAIARRVAARVVNHIERMFK
jgi:hypothetical protein